MSSVPCTIHCILNLYRSKKTHLYLFNYAFIFYTKHTAFKISVLQYFTAHSNSFTLCHNKVIIAMYIQLYKCTFQQSHGLLLKNTKRHLKERGKMVLSGL